MVMCHNELCLYNSDCKGCTYEDNHPGLALIIGDSGECDCYEDFSKSPEYQNIFFKACRDEDGNRVKRMAAGKIVECNGFTLYYTEKELKPNTYCTEKKSGLCDYYHRFSDPQYTERIKSIIDNLDYGSVDNLPYKYDAALCSEGGNNAG